jgi:hypothetical protein
VGGQGHNPSGDISLAFPTASEIPVTTSFSVKILVDLKICYNKKILVGILDQSMRVWSMTKECLGATSANLSWIFCHVAERHLPRTSRVIPGGA